jgi:hypothetical protein
MRVKSQQERGLKMVISPMTQANPAAVASHGGVTPAKKAATQPQPQPAAKDTVQISAAGQSALQEASETRAQAMREAQSGDVQAQQKLARMGVNNEEAKESPMVKAQEANAKQGSPASSAVDLKA